MNHTLVSVLPRRVYSMMTVLGLVTLGGCSGESDPWLSSDRSLHDVTVIDLVDGRAHPSRSIVIRDERILAVLDADDALNRALPLFNDAVPADAGA